MHWLTGAGSLEIVFAQVAEVEHKVGAAPAGRSCWSTYTICLIVRGMNKHVFGEGTCLVWAPSRAAKRTARRVASLSLPLRASALHTGKCVLIQILNSCAVQTTAVPVVKVMPQARRSTMLLEQKNAVIYGAGGAVGGAVARVFAREGARVFLTGRTRAPLDVVASDIVQAGGVAETALLDALDQQAVERHLADVVERAGRIDISFNAISIGYQLGQFLTEMALDAFTQPIAEAMRTQFVTTTAAARHMIQQRAGVILAISATPARQPIPQNGNFGVSCAAIESLCRQLAGELGPHGIRVICLRSAGSAEVLQAVFAELGAQLGISAEAFEARIVEQTLLKRLPKLVEFANAAALMASDYASAMTGSVANVTCGATVE
jgi:NAD(P)-dependent dehydrogenase (short-subunit alcohol dehydrogenase family)